MLDMEIDKVYKNISLNVVKDKNQYQIDFIKLNNLHVLIYCNGINTQCIIPRHIRDNVFQTYDKKDTNNTNNTNDNNLFLKELLINLDTTYAPPYWERFFKDLLELEYPEVVY